MKKIPLLVILIAGLLAASCSKKAPEFVNTIPDNAFVVMSMHPQQIFDKGQISSFESIKKEITDEFILNLIDHPTKSGIMLNEYSYAFVYFIEDNPVVGFVAGMADEGDFEAVIENIQEKKEGEIIEKDGINLFYPDGEASLSWDSEKVLFLASTEDDLSSEEMMAEVSRLFNLEKENAITSLVNFNDFSGKMKDLNIWLSSDEAKKMMEMSKKFKDMQVDIPFQLDNNYAQLFFEFVDGAMYMHSESHFSEEVSKNVEEFVVTKQNINENLLDITPGGDLLLALAVSMDLDKFQAIMGKLPMDDMPDIGGKIEEATGVPAEDIWSALNGDFVLAINGIEDGGMIPVEALIGIGVKNDELQKKLMGTVGGMVPVEDQGDFFLINTNGIEIYSGIVEDVWVITNAKGYKDAISGSGLDASLKDSKFMDYAGGGMGMYLNLDLSSYPAALQAMMSQDPEAAAMLELVTESLTSLGMEASQYESDVTLITAKKDENSLYTIMKLTEEMD
jgi:hypothetical protein